jgi:hypothetical protein
LTPRVAHLLAELSILGVKVIPDGKRLRLSPRSALTPDLVLRGSGAEVRDHLRFC